VADQLLGAFETQCLLTAPSGEAAGGRVKRRVRVRSLTPTVAARGHSGTGRSQRVSILLWACRMATGCETRTMPLGSGADTGNGPAPGVVVSASL